MNGKARTRVLISHQGCIPIYRKGLFERLARIEDIDYVVAYGNPPRGTDYLTDKGPYKFQTLRIINYELSLGSTSIIWQPLFLRFLRGFDAAILGDEVKYLSHVAIIAAAKIRKKPVILWGFGDWSSAFEPKGQTVVARLVGRVKKVFRRVMLRGIDGYLAYTERGAKMLKAAGVDELRIATLYNTVDIDEQKRLRILALGSSDAECRRQLGVGPEGPVLLYFGRFTVWKRLELLVDYARRAESCGRQVFVVFCGGGHEKDGLVARAAGLKNIVFHVALDDLNLARALRIAAAVVIPGHVGLAITHSFAHGVPVITSKSDEHPPEVEYLVPGENCLILPRDPERFFKGLDSFLDDADLQMRLGHGAYASAAQLSMEKMAGAFDALVRRLISSPDKGRALKHHRQDRSE